MNLRRMYLKTQGFLLSSKLKENPVFWVNALWCKMFAVGFHDTWMSSKGGK